jgi:WD40 repeat protein
MFAISADAVLYCFETEKGELLKALKLHDRDATTIAYHPHRGVLASASIDGTMKLWTA